MLVLTPGGAGAMMPDLADRVRADVQKALAGSYEAIRAVLKAPDVSTLWQGLITGPNPPIRKVSTPLMFRLCRRRDAMITAAEVDVSRGGLR